MQPQSNPYYPTHEFDHLIIALAPLGYDVLNNVPNTIPIMQKLNTTHVGILAITLNHEFNHLPMDAYAITQALRAALPIYRDTNPDAFAAAIAYLATNHLITLRHTVPTPTNPSSSLTPKQPTKGRARKNAQSKPD